MPSSARAVPPRVRAFGRIRRCDWPFRRVADRARDEYGMLDGDKCFHRATAAAIRRYLAERQVPSERDAASAAVPRAFFAYRFPGRVFVDFTRSDVMIGKSDETELGTTTALDDCAHKYCDAQDRR